MGRIFVIGLDSATYDFVDRWVSEGHLPTFKKLISQGVKGELTSVIPPVTTPAWTSFLTGKNPSNHGLFSWIRRKGAIGMEPFNKTHIKGESIGELLSRNGKKVGLVNIPSTYPPSEVNGFVVTGLETPSRESSFTYPASLKEELLSKFDYEIERSQKFRIGEEDSYLEVVENVERKRQKAVLHLMDTNEWDFFMVVYRGTDILNHVFFRHQDPGYPLKDPEGVARYGDVMLNHYKLMDQTIAEIWERLNEDDTILMMSDHGSCAFWRYVYLDNLFMKHGLLNLKKSFGGSIRRTLFNLGLTPENVLKLINRLKLRNLARKLVPQKNRVKVSSAMLLGSSVDWSRSVAFPFGGFGQIYINVEGREDEGCVKPGEQYEDVVQRIIAALNTLKEPLDGQPMVANVIRKEELGADLMDPLVPDLFVQWVDDRYADFGGIGMSRDTTSDILAHYSGTHSMRGLFLAHGPDFQQGTVIDTARIIDLAPTICHLLDLPVPTDMDGRVLEEAYRPGVMERKPVRFTDPADSGTGEQHELNDQEREQVEERLRNLGYID